MTGTDHPSEDCTCTVDEAKCPLWVHLPTWERDPLERADRDAAVNHPAHYTSHPSGVECVTVAEWFPFNVGNAIKYLWRAGEKGDAIQDLEKARWYVEREIQRLTAAKATPPHAEHLSLGVQVTTTPLVRTYRDGPSIRKATP